MKAKGVSYINEIEYAKIGFRNKHPFDKPQFIQTRGTIRIVL